MPAVVPLSPQAIRELLESHRYEVILDDGHNWAFARGDEDAPVLVPYMVDLVPVEVAFNVARKVGFNDYFDKLLDVPGQLAHKKDVH